MQQQAKLFGARYLSRVEQEAHTLVNAIPCMYVAKVNKCNFNYEASDSLVVVKTFPV